MPPERWFHASAAKEQGDRVKSSSQDVAVCSSQISSDIVGVPIHEAAKIFSAEAREPYTGEWAPCDFAENRACRRQIEIEAEKRVQIGRYGSCVSN
jgi:hypothetical protein